jgi:hypothetical protein
MKLIITETQLKKLRKYMKTFINENYDDNIPSGTERDPNAPWNKDKNYDPFSYDQDGDDNKLIFDVYIDKKIVAKVSVDFDLDEVLIKGNRNAVDENGENIYNNIENKIYELKDEGVLSDLIENDVVDYYELIEY